MAITAQGVEQAGSIARLSLGDSAPRVPRIRGDRYPITHTFEGVDYQVYKVGRDNMDELRKRALTFERHFGYDDPFLIHDKVRSYVKPGTEVVFAVRKMNWRDLLGSLTRRRDRYSGDIAVVTQDIKTIEVGGEEKKVVAPGIRVVKPDFQQHGIGRYLAKDAIMRHQPDFVIGKSRTVHIPRMNQDIGLISGIPPIDRQLTIVEERAVRQTLDKRTLDATDLRIGIAFGIYPPGDSERFMRPTNSVKGAEMYDRLRDRGFAPERGDGFVYCGVVDREAVQREIESGYLLREGKIPLRIRILNRVIGVAESIATRLPLL